MLFQIVHTHTVENCPARSPEAIKPATVWWQALKKTPGVKVMSGVVSPLDHTFWIVVEADNYSTLMRSMGHLVSVGTGTITPVLNLDESFPMAEAGAFRAVK